MVPDSRLIGRLSTPTTWRQAFVWIIALATLAAVVMVGAFLAIVTWQDYKFDNSPYCKPEPHDDPLC